MSIAHEEAVACLKVLIALMKADGAIDPEERKSLAAAVGGFESELGAPLAVEGLLEADTDVEGELARIRSAEARAQLYRSACFMVHADGKNHPAEVALLETITRATTPTAEERERVARMLPPVGKGRIGALLEGIGGLFGRAR